MTQYADKNIFASLFNQIKMWVPKHLKPANERTWLGKYNLQYNFAC